MERYIQIAIVTHKATYCVNTLEELDAERKFLRTVSEPIERIEVRCYEKDSEDIWGCGECICKQVIG